MTPKDSTSPRKHKSGWDGVLRSGGVTFRNEGGLERAIWALVDMPEAQEAERIRAEVDACLRRLK